MDEKIGEFRQRHQYYKKGSMEWLEIKKKTVKNENFI